MNVRVMMVRESAMEGTLYTRILDDAQGSEAWNEAIKLDSGCSFQSALEAFMAMVAYTDDERVRGEARATALDVCRLQAAETVKRFAEHVDSIIAHVAEAETDLEAMRKEPSNRPR